MARVLLIDDEPQVRSAVGRFLRTLGHDVLEAAGGNEALRLADRLRVDLVITDVNMPDGDGIEVMMALRRRAPDLPIITISGGGRLPKELLLANAQVLGAVTTLAKPFELTDLRDAVAGALMRGGTPSGATGGES